MSSQLPLILAGPMPRRVEQDAVWVWLATSKSVHVKVEIYPTEKVVRALGEPIGLGESDSIPLGDNLHIALVKVEPVDPTRVVKTGTVQFPVDKLLAYDVELLEKSPSTTTTSPPALPSAPGGPANPAQPVVTKRLKDLGLLNNPAGLNYPGSDLPTFFIRDPNSSLAILHGSCRKLHGEGEDALALADEMIGKYPGRLDWRPSALFLTGDQIYADDVAGVLIGHLSAYGAQLLGWKETLPQIGDPAALRIDGRQEVMMKKPGFTSGHAGNHLITFSEFAAMYLVAWNEENWPERLPEPAPSVEDFSKQIKALNQAREVLPKVRRALANIATYMMFDDHEITDDWNITRSWRDTVYGNPAGRRIVANGLAAFWAFQGWGNQPDKFDDNFKNRVSAYLASHGKTGEDEYVDTLLKFPHWGFVAPTTPPTLFLDTRTQRDYDVEPLDVSSKLQGQPPRPPKYEPPGAAPKLLSAEVLEDLDKYLKKANYQPSKPLLIVSPAPVYGFELVEEAQAFLASLMQDPGAFDLESWRANPAGFYRLLNWIAEQWQPRYCVFLSGDVHYAFSINALFEPWFSQPLRCIQLTSSALKNTGQANRKVVGKMAEPVPNRTDHFKGWVFAPASARKAGVEDLPADTLEKKRRGLRIRAALNKEPVILHADDADLLDIKERPNWQEKITYVAQQAGDELPIIGDNNLGFVRFEGESRVAHQLLVPKNGRAQAILVEILLY